MEWPFDPMLVKVLFYFHAFALLENKDVGKRVAAMNQQFRQQTVFTSMVSLLCLSHLTVELLTLCSVFFLLLFRRLLLQSHSEKMGQVKEGREHVGKQKYRGKKSLLNIVSQRMLINDTCC